MAVTLDEMKQYLRIDYDDDDSLIESFILTSKNLCLDILRQDDESILDKLPQARTAILYSTSYLYEHREEADFNRLSIDIRALLFSEREGVF